MVEDLDAAIAVFTELGLKLEGRAPIEGAWAGRVTGVRDQRVEIAMMRTPDAHISPGYNNTMGGVYPLHGRQVFGETSAGYPAWVPTTVNLGTAYAGQTVRIRFWVEGDFHYSAPGWMIDDVSFTGITNAPFISINVEAGSCNIAGVEDAVPAVLAFAINGENPGRGRPSFRFELPTPSRVNIAAYDVAGRRIATIADGAYAAGVHNARWEDSDAPKPGLYFVRMTADGKTINRRIVVVR